MARGTFIALEGLDGSGTSTQAEMLFEALTGRGHTVVTTHEPSRGSIGQRARAMLGGGDGQVDPHLLALLFAADRLDHIAREVEPALARGEIVVCDRYVMSSWAYQSLDCDAQWVETINARAPWPDATFLLRVGAEEATRRVHARTPESQREIFETEAIQRRVEASYEAALARGLPGVVAIDGTRSIADVSEALLQACDALGL
ncbi:MAG: dTMP kinase [Nannocystaceae bacterium]|nr:dTMP kinase [bacterium]